MHPILRDRARLGTYLLGWVPVALLFAVQASVKGTPLGAALVVGLVGAYAGSLLFLSSFFLCRALPPGAPRIGTLVATWSAAAMVMGILWSLLIFGILRLLGRLHTPLLAWSELNLPNLVVAGTIGAILYLLTAALHYLLIALEERQEVERSEQELRVLAREAELKALRAQLNPHFLFNSLNSISALTTVDPKRAREMCVLLSDFLRKSLKLGERSCVSLAEELDLVRNYLAIERIRFGPRLEVEWDVDPAVEPIQVPTLLLQPLAENAIKHGISQVPEGGTLFISAKARDGFVELRVENPVDPDEVEGGLQPGLGLGLRQVKQRLQGRFGTRAYFAAGLKENRHEVVLTLPVDDRRMETQG